MKKDVVMYKSGSIVDFQGVEHKFMVCALSTDSYDSPEHGALLTTIDENGDYLAETELPRAVFIGIAVCNPGTNDKLGDEWSEEKGRMISLAKAKGFKHSQPWKSAALFATRKGMISEQVVEALLNKEVQHIIEDPESAIKGYNKMKADYERKQALKQYIEETPAELVEVADKLAKMPEEDIDRVMTIAIAKSDEK